MTSHKGKSKKHPACSCTEPVYTSRQDSHSCNCPPSSPVTLLLLPPYLIPAICTGFHNLFSFFRSTCSIATLFVTKPGLKTRKVPTHAAQPEFRECNPCKITGTCPTGRSLHERSWFFFLTFNPLHRKWGGGGKEAHRNRPLTMLCHLFDKGEVKQNLV